MLFGQKSDSLFYQQKSEINLPLIAESYILSTTPSLFREVI